MPGVSEAIVVGAQDEDGLVRRHCSSSPPLQTRTSFIRRFKTSCLGRCRSTNPRWILFMEAIPRTATGKARRFQLRNWITRNLMPRLMRHLGLDPTAIEKEEPQSFRHMQSKCTMCESQDNCAAALEAEAEFEDFKDFCPTPPSAFVTLQRGAAEYSGRLLGRE